MDSTPEGFTEKNPISPMKTTTVKKPSAQKLLCIFTNILDVNQKNDYRQVGAAQYKRKAIKYGSTPWELKQNREIKISEEIRKALYNWIIYHPQVVQSLIANDCLKVKWKVTMNHNLFQKFYCRYLSENNITILLEKPKMAD